MKRKIANAAAAVALACGAARGADGVDVSFARGAWNPGDFIAVKSSRWSYTGAFDQLDDSIVNRCPPGVEGAELLKNHTDDVYAAIVHKRRFVAGATVSSEMSFDWRMAPIIVFAGELGAASDGTPEFREHWEVCLFDKGVNLWHHRFSGGKQTWTLAASLRVPEDAKFKPGVKYRLSAKISADAAKGVKRIDISCGGYSFSHEDPSLPEEYFAGVIGCEGRNFFYDFKVSP